MNVQSPPDDAQRLAGLEVIVERDLKTFDVQVCMDCGRSTPYELGQVLIAIRDGGLYKETHGTFEDYCRERWGLSAIET